MAVLLGCSTAAVAQTKGYALYGDVPSGYIDLTSNVTITGMGTYSDKVTSEEGVLTITGNTSLSTTRVCADETNNIRFTFSSEQTLSLTEEMALHVVLKKGSSNSNNNLHVSVCKRSWNANRIGFFMSQENVSSEEYSEVILKYGDRATTDWSGTGSIIDTYKHASGYEILRMQAATNDVFFITGIYLEATYEEPTPGPGPEPEPEPEPEPTGEKRYYFVRGGDLPTIDGVTMVDLRAPDNAAWSVNQFSNLTNDENGVQFTLPGGWGVAELKPKAQALADVTKAGWHLKMKFETDATHLNGKNLRINIGSNGGGGNLYLSETSYYGVQEMTFALADAANTMTFPVAANSQMFQLHANGSLGGTYFKVIYAYLTTDPTSEENPSAPQEEKRYYLLGGERTIDCNVEYHGNAATDSRISDYFSIKATSDKWMSVSFKPKQTIANEIDDNWYIVMRFRSSMNNSYVFGFNNFRVNLVNGGENFYLNSGEWKPYGDGVWHTVKLKLSEAAGTKPTPYLQKDAIALQLHVNNNMLPADYLDIEYIYFTNDVATTDPGTQSGTKFVLGESRDNVQVLTQKNPTDVDIARSFVADGYLYTLCLPFSLDEEQTAMYFPGELTQLESSELRGDLIHLNFVPTTAIVAGVPYLYLPSENVLAQIIEQVTMDNTAVTTIETEFFDMHGIYSPTPLTQDAGNYFLGEDNYLVAVRDNSMLKGMRAYFTIKDNAPAGAHARVVMKPQTTTAVENTCENDSARKILSNGQLIILRGGKQFTITGQVID